MKKPIRKIVDDSVFNFVLTSVRYSVGMSVWASVCEFTKENLK